MLGADAERLLRGVADADADRAGGGPRHPHRRRRRAVRSGGHPDRAAVRRPELRAAGRGLRTGAAAAARRRAVARARRRSPRRRSRRLADRRRAVRTGGSSRCGGRPERPGDRRSRSSWPSSSPAAVATSVSSTPTRTRPRSPSRSDSPTRARGSPRPAGRPSSGRSTPASSPESARPSGAPACRCSPASTGPSRWPELSESRVSAALAVCREWADYTVVDVAAPLERDEEIMTELDGPRRNAATLAALRSADLVVAVAGADPVGVSRFLRAHSELRATIGATPVAVVANKLRPGALGHRRARTGAPHARPLRRDRRRVVPAAGSALGRRRAARRRGPSPRSRRSRRSRSRCAASSGEAVVRCPRAGGAAARHPASAGRLTVRAALRSRP